MNEDQSKYLKLILDPKGSEYIGRYNTLFCVDLSAELGVLTVLPVSVVRGVPYSDRSDTNKLSSSSLQQGL